MRSVAVSFLVGALLITGCSGKDDKFKAPADTIKAPGTDVGGSNTPNIGPIKVPPQVK